MKRGHWDLSKLLKKSLSLLRNKMLNSTHMNPKFKMPTSLLKLLHHPSLQLPKRYSQLQSLACPSQCQRSVSYFKSTNKKCSLEALSMQPRALKTGNLPHSSKKSWSIWLNKRVGWTSKLMWVLLKSKTILVMIDLPLFSGTSPKRMVSRSLSHLISKQLTKSQKLATLKPKSL